MPQEHPSLPRAAIQVPVPDTSGTLAPAPGGADPEPMLFKVEARPLRDGGTVVGADALEESLTPSTVNGPDTKAARGIGGGPAERELNDG
jgi:hypothetical protein